MSELKINDVPVMDEYSETFSAQLCRILITSINQKWALEAATEAKGLGRSATAPPCEASLERFVPPDRTPDGRPGYVVQMMDRKLDNLSNCTGLRLRKGVLPNPQTSVFDWLPREYAESHIDMSDSLVRRFGDGFEQELTLYDDRRVFRIPRMDGSFHVESRFGVTEAVTGGMFLILGSNIDCCLEASELALNAAAEIPEVVVKCAASGSKVGAVNYTDMVATTNHAFCPSLREHEDNFLAANVDCVYEIIVSAPRQKSVEAAMRAGIEAATEVAGILGIDTANYGGKLGEGRIDLHGLFA